MTTPKIIIPIDLRPKPSKSEESAARIFAKHFDSNVTFVKRNNSKTADFLVRGIYWELKSPTGDGKRNVQNNLRDAKSQSANIIFDARNSKLHINKIRHQIMYFLKFSSKKQIKRLILIKKDGTIEILR